MSATLDKELTSLAFCWRLERRDGAGLALTSHDRSLTVGGVRYEPSPGMTPAAIRAETGIEPRSSEIAGALSSAAIGEADILAGRWDGASLQLAAVDWETPDEAPVDLLAGTMGQVALKDGEYAVDLLGVAAQLERPNFPGHVAGMPRRAGRPQMQGGHGGPKLAGEGGGNCRPSDYGRSSRR
jgi:hypothetical protein